MIHILASLGTLPLALGAVIVGLFSSAASVLAGVASSLLIAPILLASSFAIMPGVGIGLVLGIIEEHPELVAIGALCLGALIALFLLLRNGVNGNRNGNRYRLVNANGVSYGKRNGINGKRNGINGKNGLSGQKNGIKKKGVNNKGGKSRMG